MGIIERIKNIGKKRKNERNKLKSTIKGIYEETIKEEEENRLQLMMRKNTKEIPASDSLRSYLNVHLLYNETVLEPIREADIEELIDRIKARNKITTNEIEIPADLAYEFLEIMKPRLKARNVGLGILKLDISKRDFSIREFVEKNKDLSYTLKLKISSVNDLKSEEIGFLDSKYGIIYEYAEEEYHIDELFEMVSKIKYFIPVGEEETEHNLDRARIIANNVFRSVELYVPDEYVVESKTVTLKNGEKMGTPTFRFLENTLEYAKLKNIVINKKADYIGMKKLCRECLRVDGFDMIEHIISFRDDNLSSEFIVDGKKYAMTVKKTGIEFIEK